MFPIVIPSVGYDSGLSGMLAVSMTGMACNFGQHLDLDIKRDTFFDDLFINELHTSYLDHDISIGTLVERIRDHFDDRGGAWGFKFSKGLNLLPLYQRMYPNLQILTGSMTRAARLDAVIATCLAEDSIMSATVPEIWADIEEQSLGIEDATREQRTLVIPHELFQGHRQQALAKMAEFMGGDYRSGNVAKMVDSALRKLLHVFHESEVGSGFSS